MRRLLLALVLLLPAAARAQQNDERPVASALTKATVYLSGAQVTRHAGVNLRPGTTDLVFTGLTANLDPGSLQLDADGALTVLSISHRMNFVEAARPSPEVDRLLERRAEMEDSLMLLNATLEVYVQEEQVLLANKDIGGQDGVLAVDLQSAVAFFRERLLDIKTRQLAIRKEIRGIQQRMAQLTQQINELRAGDSRSTSEVVVTVSANAATRAEMDLRYVTPNAGWSPRYDLRVREAGSPIEWTYNADVYQSTGEDWTDVLLTLSTGNPNQSGIRPELYTWQLGFYEPARRFGATAARQVRGSSAGGGSRAVPGPPAANPARLAGTVRDAETGEALPGAAVVIQGTSHGGATDMDGNYVVEFVPPGGPVATVSYIGYESVAAPVTSERMDFYLAPHIIEAQEVVVSASRPMADAAPSVPVPVTVSQNATTVEFDIALPYTIPSDGKPRVVAIQAFTVPAQYEYFTAPKLDPGAFLTARVTDWAQYNFLSGEASLFLGGTFVGRTFLDAQNLTDTLTVSLGRDAGVVVERREREDFTTRRTFGSKVEEAHAFEIRIRNNKRAPIRITVRDQIPVSTTNLIEVDSRIGSGGTLDRETGIITWRLDVPAASTSSVEFSYEVEYPRGRSVVLE